MIQFRAFGGARLSRDGRPVTGRAAQRHPLAALALLAAAPGHAVSRDKLIAYLWPDHGSKKARHRLSVALHVLRRELGGAAISSQNDTLRLDPEVVWTDVGAFAVGVSEGRLEDAVRLYAGPFLDGFFLGGAPGFAEWAEAERRRLGFLYAEGLEQLAREAQGRGDHAAAAGFWKRLGAHDPYSGRVALEVVGALERAGDRTGALRHARAHQTRVATELGSEPDPELVELSARLATDVEPPATYEETGGPGVPTPAGGREPAPVAAPPGGAGGPPPPVRRLRPLVIGAAAGLVAAAAIGAVAVVLPGRMGGGPPSPVRGSAEAFAPVGHDPEAARLGEGVAERLLSTLAYVPGLEAAAGGSAAEEAARGQRVSFASDVGGVDGVVRGSVAREDGRFVIVAELSEPGTGRVSWTKRYERAGGNVEAIRDEVSFAIADDVRGRLVPFRPKRYTESERAYEDFLQGVYAQRRSTPEGLWMALQFYRQAIEADPGFALAHAVSANAHMAMSRSEVGPPVAFERAREHALRALALDSTLAEGWAALAAIQIWHDWEFVEGERSLRRAAMLYPTLPQVRTAYGTYLLCVRNRPAEAIASYRRALELDPLNGARSYGIERALYLARRYEEVEGQRLVTRALSPGRHFVHDGSPIADAYREMGRLDEAIAEYRRLHERTGGPPPAGLAIAYARDGRTAEAEAVLGELERAAQATPFGWEEVAAVHAALGDSEGAFDWLERAYEARSLAMITLRADPAFDPLRDDPRFRALLRRIGLSP